MTRSAKPRRQVEGIGAGILATISVGHFLNDLLQSLIPAIYPLLKEGFALSFTQVGLITLTFQMSASLLQPLVGLYTDRHPQPYFLPLGMAATLIGLVGLALAPSYGLLLSAVALVGTGSSVFHPESSRVARMVAAGRYGLAQSIFQLGGNAGASAGPLLAALIVLPRGRESLAWFALVALSALLLLLRVSLWYREQIRIQAGRLRQEQPVPVTAPEQGRAPARPVVVLLVLMFSKFFYTTSLTSYLTFYLMHRFGMAVRPAQMHLFAFLLAVAMGTILGGPIGDRLGRRQVIWWSIFGAAPFALILPHAGLFWTGPLTFVIGLFMASAFPAMVVYAQELFPGRVGMISGLLFGLAFGLAGIGAALLGRLADLQGIEFVYRTCAFLPLLGLFAVLLPDLRTREDRVREET